MISFDKIPTIYMIETYVDLRRGIDGYASMIQDVYQLSPFEDALFLFCNRKMR